MNVIGVQTQSVKGTAWMTFTVEIADAARLQQVLGIVAAVPACDRRGGVEKVEFLRCYNRCSRTNP